MIKHESMRHSYFQNRCGDGQSPIIKSVANVLKS